MLSDDEKKQLQKRYEEDKYLRKLKRDEMTSSFCYAFCPIILFFAKFFPLTILKNKDMDGSLSKSIFELMVSETVLDNHKKNKFIFKGASEEIVEKYLQERSAKMKSMLKKILFIFVFAFFSILIINNFF